MLRYVSQLSGGRHVNACRYRPITGSAFASCGSLPSVCCTSQVAAGRRCQAPPRPSRLSAHHARAPWPAACRSPSPRLASRAPCQAQQRGLFAHACTRRRRNAHWQRRHTLANTCVPYSFAACFWLRAWLASSLIMNHNEAYCVAAYLHKHPDISAIATAYAATAALPAAEPMVASLRVR